MKVITFLVDNWWLLVIVYGLYKTLTKKSEQMRRAAGLERARLMDNGPAIVRMIEESQGTSRTDPSERSNPSDAYFLEEEPSTEATAILGFQPALSEEQIRRDERDRIAAFSFIPAELESAPRADETSLAAFAPAVATPRRPLIAFGPDEIRRAIIFNEIIQPPVSRRARR